MLAIDFVELHGPLFLAGKNHGVKLFSKAGVTLGYDRTEKELSVTFNGVTAIIPSSNIASMTLAAVEKTRDAPAQRGRPKAQASTPQDHVFSEGPGKTRD